MENNDTWNQSLEEKQLQIINCYGVDPQLDQLVEECAELILAIRKYKRSVLKDPIGLIDELADVENLIGQIKLDNKDIALGVSRIKVYKVNRELERIEKCKDPWKGAR